MYKVRFYKKLNGAEPVAEYIEKLAKKQDKDSRIRLNKIRDYIKILSEYGTLAGEPYVKHIEGEIWELRPLNDRVFFVSPVHGTYVLLHQFAKKTNKTPKKEIDKAKAELADLKKRGISNE